MLDEDEEENEEINSMVSDIFVFEREERNEEASFSVILISSNLSGYSLYHILSEKVLNPK